MRGRMHADELAIDAPLLRRLLAEQWPERAGDPLEPVPSWGTDNALFRLGGSLVARVPLHRASAHDLRREERWLPYLASRLALRLPRRVFAGEPGEGYPFHWCVWEWIDGANPDPERLADPLALARETGAFVRALRSVAVPAGAPRAGRGVPLSDPERVRWTRDALDRLAGTVDVARLGAAWEDALRAPAWAAPPAWLHGDLTPGNLVLDGPRLAAVIDWGGAGVGDPAADLLPAWNLFAGGARDAFREAAGADDALWERGRGWALSTAAVALPYYRGTNPGMVALAERTLAALFGPEVLRPR